MQSPDSTKSSSSNSIESFVPDTLPVQHLTSPTKSNDSINSLKPLKSTSTYTSTNSFAPLTGRFWGDEEDEPPIQSYVHSVDDNMGLSDPQLCVQLEEDLDTSVLNQETPEHLKSTGYLSSLYSDSSPSISKTLHSPSESEYLPSSPINSSPTFSSTPFTPSVPLIKTTTNKAKKKKAKKEQAEIEVMIKAGVSQSAIDFCFRFQWSASTKSSCINPLTSQSCCFHAHLGGVHKSSKIKKILRDKNGNVGSNASGTVIVHPSSPALQFAALSLFPAQFIVQHCVYGIYGVNSSPLLIFIFPLQHSIQSIFTAVTDLADSAVHTAATFLCFFAHIMLKNWLFL
ncbi:hypothetical protein LguiA_016905 [Lonicera macranthoides]